MLGSQSSIEDQTQRWALVVQRDRSAAATFVYAVRTTGIYCRVGCPSRLPRRKNVEFFDHGRQAKAAGFRPCKRCQPDQDSPETPLHDAIRTACVMIDAADAPPTLQQLASAAGYSAAHFQRLFKQSLGVTPKAYAAMRRANRLRHQLLGEQGVAEAAFAAGYGTSSRFYDEAEEVLGMKPSEYRRGAAGIEIWAAIASTSLGPMLVAATEKGVCTIEFGEDPDSLIEQCQARLPNARWADSAEFQATVKQVVEFVEATDAAVTFPLDIRGTAFQRRVWDALQNIPAGTTSTYSAIANQIGKPTAVRAVAGACAANRLAIAIPCHRVQRSDGGLGGFRWGLERKKLLIERESDEQDHLR